MRTSTRTQAAIGAIALGVALLTAGCGGGGDSESTAEPTESVDPVEAYCDVLQKNQIAIAAFAGGSPDFTKFGELVVKIGEVQDAATEDVQGDWKLVHDNVAQLQGSLTAAGTDLGAVVGSAMTGKLPDGVTPEEMTGLGQQLQALQGEEMKAAIADISKFSEPACGVELVSVP